MRLPGFVGPSNVLRSNLEDPQRTINFFPETAQVGNTKTDGWLRCTPGSSLAFTVNNQPVTCLFSQDDRAFGVAGTQFFEFFGNNTYAIRGTVAFDGIDLATISSNGSAGDQLFITAGSNGYIFTLSTDALALIADVDFPNGSAAAGEFFGGYFFVLVRDSRQFRWSALEDGTDWDPLDVAERSWGSDNIVSLKRNHTDIWLLGSRTSEVWYATGDITVFAPAQGSFIEHGCIARESVCRVAQTLVWLDQDERGGGVVVIAQGYQPTDISTYAINRIVQSTESAQMFFAKATIRQMDGHVFYSLLNHPDFYDTQLVYDFTEKAWHEWAHWDATNCVWHPHRCQAHCFAFELHWIGDRSTGVVYQLSFDTLTDELAIV